MGLLLRFKPGISGYVVDVVRFHWHELVVILKLIMLLLYMSLAVMNTPTLVDNNISVLQLEKLIKNLYHSLMLLCQL